jgi:DNA-binding NarL/FixJ family response regulator
MLLDQHFGARKTSGSSGAVTRSQGASAAVHSVVGEQVRKLSVRKLRLHIRIALIDEFPLRRGSTVDLLRLHVSKETSAFGSVDELCSQVPVESGASQWPQCVILSVGGRSVRQAPFSDALRHLGRLGEAQGSRPISCPIIVLSDLEDIAEMVASFQAGARGFIPTSLNPRLVIAAIQFVIAGGAFIPAKVVLRSYRSVSSEAPAVSRPDEQDEVMVPDMHEWPPRQLAVMHLLGEGKTNKDIAVTLGMEESTVKVHVRHIMRKLGVTNRTRVALYVRRAGLAVPPAGDRPSVLPECHVSAA